MIRVKVPFLSTAQGSLSSVPHSWGLIMTSVVEGDLRTLWSTLKAMAPAKAGEEGWSVIVTVDACARAQTTDGNAAPAG